MYIVLFIITYFFLALYAFSEHKEKVFSYTLCLLLFFSVKDIVGVSGSVILQTVLFILIVWAISFTKGFKFKADSALLPFIFAPIGVLAITWFTYEENFLTEITQRLIPKMAVHALISVPIALGLIKMVVFFARLDGRSKSK
ncbi:hypothetical protein [Pseudoalteromonas sp. S16_S37]|uniref:hypothetical protein n=1 Tax=Pseudoalteromonas sp. S16_S37 TaxID=2720228 RepID=UPI001680899E|nr:hypothetical protein [Pseudoalteromonas sp. S16_S37]MBD1582818.1 hypothetical protein [Pseudoalteromonas sp. S16_S37]